MRLRPTHLCLAIFASAVLFVPPAAHAFTFENGRGKSDATPQFDIEEQARNFRTRDLGAAFSDGKRDIETPFGKGTLQFGVQQNNSLFGSGFRSQEDRRHMDRMLAPPGLQHNYDR